MARERKRERLWARERNRQGEREREKERDTQEKKVNAKALVRVFNKCIGSHSCYFLIPKKV